MLLLLQIRPHDCLFSSLIRPHDCLFSSLQKVLPLLRARSQPQAEHVSVTAFFCRSLLGFLGGHEFPLLLAFQSEEIRQEVLSFYSTRIQFQSSGIYAALVQSGNRAVYSKLIWYELVDVLEAGTEHEVSLDISSIRSRWFLYSMSQHG
ncbi:hypothetical protein EJB05_48009, partial [Eragrostis curvula]